MAMWNLFRCRHMGVAAREHGEWLGGLPHFLKLGFVSGDAWNAG